MEWFTLLNYIQWWIYFGIIHSVTANHSFKERFPIKGKLYRLFYNFISVLTLFIVLMNQPSITSYILNGFELTDFKFAIFVIIVVLGGSITIIGLYYWDIPGFIGLTNPSSKLETSGVFAFSRHPVYLGIILLFFAPILFGISAETLSWLIGAGGYFIIGSYFEEINLAIYFEEYLEYKKNVGRFFPWRKHHFKYLFRSFRS